jgi:hypothetical protein
LINLELVTIAEQYYNETYTNGLWNHSHGWPDS